MRVSTSGCTPSDVEDAEEEDHGSHDDIVAHPGTVQVYTGLPGKKFRLTGFFNIFCA